MSPHSAALRSARLSFCGVLAFLLLAAISGAQQEVTHRLILKDGSYQLVTRYEVKGDRVRYYSSEREDWEELPNSLVDWPATEKYEKDRASADSAPEAVQLDKQLDQQREAEEQQLPEVAPGLRLPENSGVFLLDSFQGQPQLNELQQAEGDVNRNTKGNIFKGALNPVAGLKETIELDHPHAAVQSHVGVPSLYISVDSSDQSGLSRIQLDSARSASTSPSSDQAPPSDRFRILHAEVKGNKRILGDVKRAMTGKISQDQKFVKTTLTSITGGWFKVTPTESLPPGEYAVVEMMGKEGMNLYVWDFGVNPKAPANANPWKPEAKAASPKPDQ